MNPSYLPHSHRPSQDEVAASPRFPSDSAASARGPVLWLGFVCIPLLLAVVWLEPAALAAVRKPRHMQPAAVLPVDDAQSQAPAGATAPGAGK